jgi:hypothetical protein
MNSGRLGEKSLKLQHGLFHSHNEVYTWNFTFILTDLNYFDIIKISAWEIGTHICSEYVELNRRMLCKNQHRVRETDSIICLDLLTFTNKHNIYNNQYIWNIICHRIYISPITVATRCNAGTVFARSNTGVVCLNPTLDIDVWLRLFCVCVVLCVDSKLATGSSNVQGILSIVYRIKKLKINQGRKGYRATRERESEYIFQIKYMNIIISYVLLYILSYKWIISTNMHWRCTAGKIANIH